MLLLAGCFGLLAAAWRLDQHHGALGRRYWGHTREIKVFYAQRVANVEFGDVGLHMRRDVLRQATHIHLFEVVVEATAGQDARGASRNADRQGNRYRVAIVQDVEVGVERTVGNRMKLHILDDGGVALAINAHVDDLRVFSLEEALKLQFWHGEMDVLGFWAVHNCRNRVCGTHFGGSSWTGLANLRLDGYVIWLFHSSGFQK